MHGHGTLNLPNSAKYIDSFGDDDWYGQLPLNLLGGLKYVEKFKDGKTHGQGAMFFQDGTKYSGYFVMINGMVNQ